MLLIPARADRSRIHGLGVFAETLIPAGTAVWRFSPPFDRSFTLDAYDSLPEPAQRHLRHYGYLDLDAGTWVLNGDLSIFMNHSANPNTGARDTTGPADETIALRDIVPGEELTCDYRAFDGSQKPINT